MNVLSSSVDRTYLQTDNMTWNHLDTLEAGMEDGEVSVAVLRSAGHESVQSWAEPADGDGDGSLAPGQTPRQDRYTTAQI